MLLAVGTGLRSPRCWALTTRVAAISSMARVIFLVFWTLLDAAPQDPFLAPAIASGLVLGVAIDLSSGRCTGAVSTVVSASACGLGRGSGRRRAVATNWSAKALMAASNASSSASLPVSRMSSSRSA